MTKIEQRLTDLKTQIEDAEKNVATHEGRKQESLQRLQDDFGLTSLDGASEAIKEKTEKRTSLEATIQKKFNQLEKDYTW